MYALLVVVRLMKLVIAAVSQGSRLAAAALANQLASVAAAIRNVFLAPFIKGAIVQ